MSMTLINQIIVIFLLAAIGYIARKAKLMDDKIQSGVSGIVLYVGIPGSILASASKPLETAHFKSIGMILAGAALYYVLIIPITEGMAKAGRLERKKGVIFSTLIANPNVAFIGYPVISIFMPEDGVFFASFFVIVFNLCFFIYGLGRISGQKALSLKGIFNINAVAALLLVALYVLQIRVPDALQTTFELLGGISTPLSMLVIGSMLAGIPFRQLFTTHSLYVVSAMRLLVIPTIVFFVARWLALPTEVSTVLLIMCALPSAAAAVMAAERYNCEPVYASKGVLLSTLLFLVTIPYIAFLQGLL